MLTSEFDFDLPETAIALRPVRPRDAARMLVVPGDGSAFADRIVRDLADVLAPGDLLILNDTRVVPARLGGVRLRDGASGAHIEATLAERFGPDRWTVLAKPAKRLRPGDRILFAAPADAAALEGASTGPRASPDEGADGAPVLSATVAGRDEGFVTLVFDVAGAALDAAIAQVGRMPLPPYIEAKRAVDAEDREDYQTVFAREAGAVAAPTAGLHLTPELLARLGERGIGHAFVTLHVGAGTFLPVKAERTEEHRMHSEHATLTEAVAARIAETRARGGRIVAVGTTALRVLESAAGEDGVVRPFHAPTDIFITPGYRFRAVDVLMTNFHLPRSTLFMLVSAFSGLERMRAAYAHAIAAGYRFYSYGDASLLFRAEPA